MAISNVSARPPATSYPSPHSGGQQHSGTKTVTPVKSAATTPKAGGTNIGGPAGGKVSASPASSKTPAATNLKPQLSKSSGKEPPNTEDLDHLQPGEEREHLDAGGTRQPQQEQGDAQYKVPLNPNLEKDPARRN